jgi:hypothetical protein
MPLVPTCVYIVSAAALAPINKVRKDGSRGRFVVRNNIVEPKAISHATNRLPMTTVGSRVR